jgi:hypothetical protein
MDVYIRTKGRLIKAVANLLIQAWMDHFTDDKQLHADAKVRYREIVGTSKKLHEAFKAWCASASMSQLLELDQMFTIEETLDTTIFPYICTLYEAQSDLLLMLMAADIANLQAHSGTLKMVFWRKDSTFARMFVEKFKKTDLWVYNETMCRSVCSGIVSSI